jgi:tRNA threonylcarbamoyladenosine biosynthesis protein TsaB
MELSIDTTSEAASVALSQEGVLRAELTWLCHANHSVEVLPAIDRLLTTASVARSELDAIFVCRGPGSYGGLRAGLSLAMSLASALGVPVLGAGRLEVDAYQHAAFPGPICPIHRAGRGELAWAVYEAAGGELTELRGPALIWPEDLAAQAPRGALFCGEVDAALAGALRTADLSASIAAGAASVRRAGFLAELAWRRFARGERAAAGFVEPLYLREPQITKAKRPRPARQLPRR